ncbi:MAG: hypothetical protein LN417_01185, partial [Candidatus Thermoplasmatota archaeon]|nr:hypothetical protein [Candidatus Thermoplasmatota archaeon]
YLLVASLLLVSEMSRPIDGVPFTTFAEGSWSGFRYDDSSYSGEYMVIRNQSAWASFWYNHTGDRLPQPPVPTNISWESQMVLVALQGFVRNCCASYVRFFHMQLEGDTLYAHVENVHRDGMMMAVTNPYHIIVLESVPNVVFRETSEAQDRPNLVYLILLAVLLFAIAAMVLLALRWRPRMKSLR